MALTVKRLMLAVLLICFVWIGGAYFVGTDVTCMNEKANLCNRKPPEECRFEDSEVDNVDSPAIDPENLFKVSVLVDTPPRWLYLKLEWLQDLVTDSDLILVRVSPLLQGQILKDQIICMSNSSYLNTNINETLTLSTLVRMPEKVTSSYVEVKFGKKLSKYLVVAPKLKNHSWMLPAVSITKHGNKAYISVSAPDIGQHVLETDYSVIYGLTLMCYSPGDDHPEQENKTGSGLGRSFKQQISCSDSEVEVYLQFEKVSSRPIVYDMTREIYQLVVDAQLRRARWTQAIAETSMWTPFFGPKEWKQTEQSEMHTYSVGILQENATLGVGVSNATELQLENKNSSSSSSSSSNGSTVLVIVTISVVATFAILCLGLAVKLSFGRICRRDSISPTVILENNENLEKTQSKQGNYTCDFRDTMSKKQKIHHQCCNNRFSDISDYDASDPLISIALRSHQAFDQLFEVRNTGKQRQDSVNIESPNEFTCHSCNYLWTSEYGLERNNDHSNLQLNDTHVQHISGRMNQRVRGKQKARIQNNVILEMTPCISKDITTRLSRHQITSLDSSNYQYATDESSGYFSKETGSVSAAKFPKTYSVSETDLTERNRSDWETLSIIEPNIYVDSLNMSTMNLECVKINEMYETLASNLSQAQVGLNVDDECFSVCESIAC